jgi:hypothetical protein
MIRLLLVMWLLVPLAWPLTPLAADTALPDQATLRTWIREMKTAPRGPFSRIRWFCKDGTILPPRPYACGQHGGGAQHGEWNQRTKRLRAGGYMIANILADLDVEAFVKQPDYRSTYEQILLEQFLIASDDGWILRRARFYRGALQAEEEERGARRLLLELVEQPNWFGRDLLPLRIGARFLPHGQETDLVQDVRQHSAALSKRDPEFMPLRNKIHVIPDAEDAARVREYAAGVEDQALRAAYERLAADIDSMYAAASATQTLTALARQLDGQAGGLGASLQDGAAVLASTKDPARRLVVTSRLMAELRKALPTLRGARLRLRAVDSGLVLEGEHFVAATALRARLPGATRRERLTWLQASVEAVYGAGLLSARQLQALRQAFARLSEDQVPLETYKTELDYLARVPGWATQWLRFHFQDTVRHFVTIEPQTDLFIQDQLRGSPLLFFANVLDGLVRDADRLAGVRHQLFDAEVGAGLRSLNPGLARGVLRLAPRDGETFMPDGIYVLPETTAELPPVAGILTAGAGNPLSHVQLLARNLGIPNVGVDEALIPRLAKRQGTPVVLAVSAAGSVLLTEDRGQWDAVFGTEPQAPQTLIRPDLDKLDLDDTTLTPVGQLRASDSGRIVGPKAAKLGELKHHFPEAVAAGLAIPFGVFRALLEQPMPGEGADVFTWMVERYGSIRSLPDGSLERIRATEALRQRLQEWILHADPGAAFRRQLRTAMERVFGADGTYGVFVRSDTNVEDLPGFTGAGLNLTVPNVVGFDRVMQAIPRVWASPFSQRAYAWRQAHMDQPQHVYPAILLLRSVPVEKSGVMVTQDIDTGAPGWLSVAVNEGVGGAVEGQAAESLRVNLETGEVRLLSQATARMRRVLLPEGGVAKVPVSDADRVLSEQEIATLVAFARSLPQRFPALKDAAGNPTPADIEFGFLNGQLQLFQIRPFLESARAQSSRFLRALDGDMHQRTTTMVAMQATPAGTTER